jgi:hypothetical protein
MDSRKKNSSRRLFFFLFGTISGGVYDDRVVDESERERESSRMKHYDDEMLMNE